MSSFTHKYKTLRLMLITLIMYCAAQSLAIAHDVEHINNLHDAQQELCALFDATGSDVVQPPVMSIDVSFTPIDYVAAISPAPLRNTRSARHIRAPPSIV